MHHIGTALGGWILTPLGWLVAKNICDRVIADSLPTTTLPYKLTSRASPPQPVAASL